jgi:dGTPase
VDVSVFEPPDWLDREEEVLAPYAMRTRQSRGRRHPEPAHAFRTLYQRDRDRIVHSTAFRRLMYKTQVFVSQTGDHHRTRLTHTLEVAQISRTIARQLGLNEDLTEAIALMHDLGHPPFGHAGERVLNDLMADRGGFEHNWHGLRIVEELEYRYPDFPGLNLSWEVLESQAMHSKAKEAPEVKAFLGVGQPLLEAQVVDAADSLAYNTHDIDDALSVGLLSIDDLREVAFFREAEARVRGRHGNLTPLNFQPTVVRGLIDWQVTDLLENTQANLRKQGIESIADVRRSPTLLAEPGAEVAKMKRELELFLRERVYRHYRVTRMVRKGQRMIRRMFDELLEHPEQLPRRYHDRASQCGMERSVCDYVAGMTDRYAQEEYMRLFHPGTSA